jgi:putative ABC transport system permease protein
MPNDLRDALRVLRRAPTFALVAITTLALAIGSTTAVFSVIDAILIRGLPYGDAARLQSVYERHEQGALRVPSYPTFRDWQAQSATIGGVIEGLAYARGDAVMVEGSEDRHIAAYVSRGFFDLLATQPAIGRAFRPEDERPGAPRVAVISHDFFMRRFGGDRAALAKPLVIDSVATTIIGVMPRGFAYPNFGAGGWLPPAVWEPIAAIEQKTRALSLRGLHVDSRTILRLRPGADSARAATAMRTIAQRLATEYPVEQAHWTAVEMRPLSQEMFGGLSSTLWMIAGAIGLVLLLACANVANLLLVRTSVRARELAVRAALGAGGMRIARHLFAEAAVLAAFAGVIGVALSTLLLEFLRPYAAERLPFATNIAIDSRAVLVAVGLSAATALLIGMLPALHVGRGSLVSRLRGGAGGASDTGGVAERRARDTLVAIQFALAITVLIGAGLLVQSVRRVSSVPLGFDPDGVVSFSVRPPRGKYDAPEQAAALYQRILAAVNAVPSVQATAAAGGALLRTKVETDDQRGAVTALEAFYHPISADYLKIRRIPLASGRGFTDEDMRSANGFLITQNLAKQLWPNASPLGHRITVYRSSQARVDFGSPITLPVVGVVADHHEFGAEAPSPPQVFLPYTLEVWPWMTFIARTSNPGGIARVIDEAVKNIEPAIEPMGRASAARTGLVASFGDPRVFVTSLLSGFAATALLLAAVGLYGIVAYGVTQRTRELGIRIAVGATPRAIVRLVLAHASRLVVTGLVVGLGAATLATKFLQSLLFQTSGTDLVTYAVVPLVLLIVATIASLIPALRATRTDPLVVIRAE